MTTDTKPDPLKWLRAVAMLPTRKSDGVAATETLAHIARLQAQVDALAVALREIVNLCAVGDVDESTEALGWGAVIKDANAALAAAGR